jgi:hypothetical protein
MEGRVVLARFLRPMTNTVDHLVLMDYFDACRFRRAGVDYLA